MMAENCGELSADVDILVRPEVGGETTTAPASEPHAVTNEDLALAYRGDGETILARGES